MTFPWWNVTLYEKWSFLLRISSVNVTHCGFGCIYWRNTSWKTSYFKQARWKCYFWYWLTVSHRALNMYLKIRLLINFPTNQFFALTLSYSLITKSPAVLFFHFAWFSNITYKLIVFTRICFHTIATESLKTSLRSIFEIWNYLLNMLSWAE